QVGQLGEADDGGVASGLRIDIDNRHRIGLVGRAGERRDIRELLRRRGRRVPRRAVEGRILMMLVLVMPFGHGEYPLQSAGKAGKSGSAGGPAARRLRWPPLAAVS